MSDDNQPFEGFEDPLENWCKLPLSLIKLLPVFSSKAEILVVLYILRHTWGYREYDEHKVITVDEFVNGRKKKDGTRIDNGTGLTEPSVRSGLKEANAHGFIDIATDDHDKARVKKGYMLKMANPDQGEKSLPPGGKKFTPGGKEVLPRSEKDTLDNKPKKDSIAPNGASAVSSRIPAAQMNPMKDAIVAAFAWGWETMTGPEKGLVQKTAKALVQAEITPEQISSLHRYCKNKFTDFGPGALANHVSAWKATQPKPRPAVAPVADEDEGDGVPSPFEHESGAL